MTAAQNCDSCAAAVVPVVDLGLPDDEVAEQVRRACSSVGFFHGAHVLAVECCVSVCEQSSA
jgi:hypothetical protein